MIKLIYATNQQTIAYLNSRKGVKWFFFKYLNNLQQKNLNQSGS